MYSKKNNGTVKSGFYQQTGTKHIINANQQSYVESKSCKTNLLFFYEKIISPIDKSDDVGTEFFIFNTAFDLVPQKLQFKNKLELCKINRVYIRYNKKYLTEFRK